MCQSCDVTDETVDDVGPVEPDKSEIREDPYSLPDKFKWDSLNLDDDKQVSSNLCGDFNMAS